MVAIFETVKRIYLSRQPLLVILRLILLVTAGIMALANLGFSLRSLLPPYVYQKDYMQEYLLARAVLEGEDPYLPLPNLADHFLEPLQIGLMPNPTPHPPPVALLILPFGTIPYIPSAIFWYLFEVVCIVLVMYLLLSWMFGNLGIAHVLVTILFILLWSPFRDELTVGQLMSILLLLLVGAWLALRSGYDWKAGILLGMVIALKLFAWPILIYCFLSRRWKTTTAAVATLLVANVAAGFLIGFDRVILYYLEIGPQVEPLYRSHERNFSAWSLGYRVFIGTNSPVITGVEAPPLIYAPFLAHFLSIFVTGLLVLLALVLALNARSLDTSIAILASMSLITNPVAWSHYLILATLPIAILLSRFNSLVLGKFEGYLASVVALLLFAGGNFNGLLYILMRPGFRYNESLHISFSASLITLIPALAILGLVWLLWRSERSLCTS